MWIRIALFIGFGLDVLLYTGTSCMGVCKFRYELDAYRWQMSLKIHIHVMVLTTAFVISICDVFAYSILRLHK